MTAARLTALAVAAALAAGCGGDDAEIPRAEAAELRSALLEAKRRLAPLRCGDLSEDSLPKLEERVAALPDGSDVRESLQDGIDHLRDLIEAECTRQEQEREQTTTEEEPTTTTEPPTTTTEPPTTTEEEPPTTTEEEPPPTTPDTDEGANGDGTDGGGQAPPSGAARPGKGKRDKKDKG